MSSLTQLTLFSDPQCQYSHRVRLVLAEKNLSPHLIWVGQGQLPPLLGELNPYGSLPTLGDRDLALYTPQVILEYLEERYPHPALLPAYPAGRAQIRLLMYRIGRDWCEPAERIASASPEQRERLRKELRESLTGVAVLFAERPFFMSDEMTLVDCCLLPLLWRLPQFDIELPRAAKGLHNYMERHFARPAFRASLSDTERQWR